MAIPRSISDFLERNHAEYTVLEHPPAYTAQEEAAAAHVPGREWAKVVVCVADERPILAVLPAPLKIDLSRLREAAHARAVRLAREDEFKGLYDDCEIGAMPPLGPLYHQDVVVDRSLADDRDIVFDAGSHRESIRMPFRQFERLVRPTVAPIGYEPPSSLRESALVSDVVCGNDVRVSKAWGWSEYQGERYYFCSQACKMEFDDNPGEWVRRPDTDDTRKA